jgi:hypothetical protein
MPEDPPIAVEHLTNEPGEQLFNFMLKTYGDEKIVIDRPDYSYAPTVMRQEDGTLVMLFCGGGGSGKHGGDSLWLSENKKNGEAPAWSPPIEVVRPSNNNEYLDFAHACDPTIIRHGNFYYILYTGATDWAPNGGSCKGSPTADGCDNRIFIVRVPADKILDRDSYQKFTNKDCGSPECFQWSSFWKGVEYPPVSVIHGGDKPVWRRAGTGLAGATAQQTQEYGYGQPTILKNKAAGVERLSIGYTNVTKESASEDLMVEPATDLENTYALQDPTTKIKRILNEGNQVNYDLAYWRKGERYLATVAEEHPDSRTNPLSRPRVVPAQYIGDDLTKLPESVISKRLGDNTGPNACACFVGPPNSHNAGFARTEDGELASIPGPIPGTERYLVVFGTNRDDVLVSKIGSASFQLVAQK